MFNPLLLPSPDRDDRPFLAYVVVCLMLFGLNSFYDASINTSFDPNPDDAQGGLMGENITLTDTQTLVLQNGESDEVELSLAANYSDDGWSLTRIDAVISYGETAAADAACDTVSVDLEMTGGGGEAAQDATTSGQANDCSDIVLHMAWPSLEASTTAQPSAPLTVVVEVELDVQSTIPFNDQDEDVQVELVLTLARMAS